MAVTIEELIAQKEALKGKRGQKYAFETSVGEIICKLPDAALVAEALEMTPSFEANKHIVFNCVVDPNLRDGDLLKIYECFEPADIIAKIFLPGEITKIANKLLDLAGFKNRITAKIYDEVKN